jgi:PmbA protein
VVDVNKVINYAEKKGAQEAEVISQQSESVYTRFELGEPKRTSLTRVTEYALRVVVDGSVGFSYFTDKWEDAVEEAVSLARSREKDERWKHFASDRPVSPLTLYQKSVNVSVEQLISDMELTSEAVTHENIVASNITCQTGTARTEIANSSGVSKKDIRSLTMLNIMCRAADAEYGMGYSSVYSLGYDIDHYHVGEQTREKALAQLGKQKIEPGSKKVILSPKVFSSLLACAVMPSFLAHNVVEGRSALEKGQKVAPETFGVTENPLVEAPPGRSFDDEGVPSQVSPLIQGKCVKNFLFDNYYGETTGSGIRYSRYRGNNLRSPPGPCATSLQVTGEESSFDDMVTDVSDGLLVVEESNSHASKSQSGLFSIAVTSGFIIKNGEIASPVRRCMISGLAFEDLLPNVTRISRERELNRSPVYPTYVDTGHVLVDSLQITA